MLLMRQHQQKAGRRQAHQQQAGACPSTALAHLDAPVGQHEVAHIRVDNDHRGYKSGQQQLRGDDAVHCTRRGAQQQRGDSSAVASAGRGLCCANCTWLLSACSMPTGAVLGSRQMPVLHTVRCHQGSFSGLTPDTQQRTHPSSQTPTAAPHPGCPAPGTAGRSRHPRLLLLQKGSTAGRGRMQGETEYCIQTLPSRRQRRRKPCNPQRSTGVALQALDHFLAGSY